ncbi:MAG: 50S ribosomal protein L13 [candidate division WOR-3 bacterium]
MRTFLLKKEEIKRDWWLVDADNKILGRLASKVASILRGKHKPNFTPNIDNGDCVVVINADKIKLTGNKEEKKVYIKHTGYLGGLKEISFKKRKELAPESIIIEAVSGMLPKNKLRKRMIKRLKVYCGVKHPYESQNLKKLEVS